MAAPVITGTNVVAEYAFTTSLSLTAPTREVGNLLLVESWIEVSNKTPSTPSGWAFLGSSERGGSLVEIFLYGRIADNTATDNFSHSWTGAIGCFGEMRRIKGNDTSISSVVVSAGNNGSSASFGFKSAIAPLNESLGIGFHNAHTEFIIKSAPSGWTADSSIWCPVVTKTLNSGATGEFSGEYNASEEWVTLLVIVPPPKSESKTVEGESTGEVKLTTEVSGIKNAQGASELPVTFAIETSGVKTTFGEVSLPTKFDFEVTGNKNINVNDITLPVQFDIQVDGSLKRIGEVQLPVKFDFEVTGHRVTKNLFEPKKIMRVKRRISLVKTRNLRNKRSFRLRGK